MLTIDERFQAPAYRTDGELLREATELAEGLDGLTGDARVKAEERLQAVRNEQASRRRARSKSRPASQTRNRPEVAMFTEPETSNDDNDTQETANAGSVHTDNDDCPPYPG